MEEKENSKAQTSFELFGIECGKGWEVLYKPLFEWVEKYNNEHPDNIITIDQVKEKFGGLRFYVDKYPDDLSEIIKDAESESYKICETCGTREHVGLTIGGWYRTICIDCLQKLLANPNYYKDKDRWKSNDDGKIYEVTKDSIELWKQEKN